MIKKIRVQNFKSLRDVSLTLGPRNVLVGPNMSGKSNLIEVFRFLSRMVLTSAASGVHVLAKALDSGAGFSEVTWKGGEANLISISLQGDFPLDSDPKKRAGWEYEISILLEPRGWVTVQKEALNMVRPEGTYTLISKANGERVLKNLDGGVISRIHDSNRSGLEFEIPDWQGNALRRFIGSWRFYRFIPRLMKQANSTAATDFLVEHGENLSSWLMMLQTRYQESFAKIKTVSRDVFPEIEDLFTWPTQQATVYVSSKEKYLKRQVSVWEMSEGQLAFIALLSLIFSPPELTGGMYCVEEPENHLHPRLLETLVELLRQVQDELGPEQSAQTIVTTHSPHLVDKVDLDELIVVEKREGETLCTRPSSKQHLRELLAREEVGLGDLYYSGALSGA
jgi:predicted ATPase